MGGSPSLSSHASCFLLSIPFLFFLIGLQFSLGSAEENWNEHCAHFQSYCGESNVSYPFTKDPKGECGLGIINCVENTPYVGYKDDQQRFEVKNISYSDETIVIHDQRFTDFIQSETCDELYNFTLPPPLPAHLSFQLIKPNNITFQICKLGFFGHIEVYDNSGLSGVKYCKDGYVMYFNASSLPPKSDCRQVEFPADVSGKAENLLDRLLMGFPLKWQLPGACHNCNGALCLIEQNGDLSCVDPNQVFVAEGRSSKARKIKIGVFSGVGGILLTCFVFFLFWYRRHRKGTLIALSKTRSSSPSLTPLSASIPSYRHYGVPVFTYEELEEATNNFNSNQELGDGGFGTVYYGKLRDGREVAVKRLYESNCKRVQQFMNEIAILARLRHQNLVTLYGCTSRHSRELLLVYEFISNGTVADHLHGDRAESGSGSLPWPTRMSIAIETAQALSYLHASDIIHRDVKTNNILLTKNFQVKVADFGLSRLFPNDVTHVSTAPQGTPGYVDPEYHQCYTLTEKSDVYSFGVVLIELISSKPAVDIARHRHEINLANLAINKIQNRAVHELVDPCLGYESDVAVRGMTTSVAALAFRCLQHDRDLRPSMDEVLEVLRGIESEDYMNVVVDRGERAEVIDIPMDYAVEGPSKNNTQLPLPSPPAVPPNSFTDKWVNN